MSIAVLMGGWLAIGAAAQDNAKPVPPPATRPVSNAQTQPAAPQTRPVATPPASAPATTAPAATSAPAVESAGQKSPAGLLKVSGQRVNVRAKPDTSSLVVTKVDTGSMLQATGKQYGWYQILPPPGVFAYVSARFVTRQADGSGVVAIESGNLRVRAGSTVFPTEDPEKNNDIVALLPVGATVRIIDQQGDWLKIAPPEGVRYYIDGRYVKPVGEDLPDTGGVTPAVAADQPAASQAASQPATSDWMKRLEALEAAIGVEAGKDAGQQNWELIRQQLSQIARQTEDAEAARLAKADLADVYQRTGTTGEESKSPPIVSESPPSGAPASGDGAGLPPATPSSTLFVAVGQLEPAFALPNGPYGLRYKLIDPYSRSVNMYVEFPAEAEINATSHVGHYVGVRGDRRYLREQGVTIVTAYELTNITKEQATTKPARKSP